MTLILPLRHHLLSVIRCELKHGSREISLVLNRLSLLDHLLSDVGWSTAPEKSRCSWTDRAWDVHSSKSASVWKILALVSSHISVCLRIQKKCILTLMKRRALSFRNKKAICSTIWLVFNGQLMFVISHTSYIKNRWMAHTWSSFVNYLCVIGTSNSTIFVWMCSMRYGWCRTREYLL